MATETTPQGRLDLSRCQALDLVAPTVSDALEGMSFRKIDQTVASRQVRVAPRESPVPMSRSRHLADKGERDV